MKIAGIIGGISPESTIEYYRQIVAACDFHPLIVINSIDLAKLVRLVTSDHPGAIEYLLTEIQRLADARVDFGAIAANTPHVVFDELRSRTPIPLISIVEATCGAAKDLRLKKVGLFGTRFTMQGQFYPKVFSRSGIALIVPDEEEQNYIHDKYMDELINGIFLPETRERLLAIAGRLIERHHIDGLILGGTELPLILRDETYRDIPLLDTTKIHVHAIVRELRK